MPGQISNASSAVGTVTVLNPNLAAGKTILYDANSADGATAVIRTVTAGKTYYLLAAGYTAKSTGGTGSATIFIDSTSNSLLRSYASYTGTYNTQSAETVQVAYPHPLPIAAGAQIKVVSTTANFAVLCWIIGWEE